MRFVLFGAMAMFAVLAVACSSSAPDDPSRAAPPSASGSNADPSGNGDPPPPPPPPATDPFANPLCLGKSPGAYCGGDAMQDADPSKLYTCDAAGKPPTKAIACANGCLSAPAGQADACKVGPASPKSYRLPWKPSTSMELTQDCNDSCCDDHVGFSGYAWDFANGGSFTVVAARGGTITHLKDDSTYGCGESGCMGDANYVVIDHGDGTQSIYLHLQGGTLRPGVTCGANVVQGQELATSGTTGWSTGVHLHFQVSGVHPTAPTCECGTKGDACSASAVDWTTFWSTAALPTLPVKFEEWPTSSSCGDRRMPLPPSQNE